MKTQDGGAGLIVIDTLNRASTGTDENSSTDMGKIITGATMLQMVTGAMVLLVHHPGKDASRGLRGHSSLYAALDTVIEVEEDGELIRWKIVKSKDSEDGISHAFSLVVVDLGNNGSGKPIKSCVVQEVEGATTCKKQSQPRGANQQAILAAVRGILVPLRMQRAFENPNWPDESSDGMPFDDVLVRIKDTLEAIPAKHWQLRTKEALDALIDKGYLTMKEGMLALPLNMSGTVLG